MASCTVGGTFQGIPLILIIESRRSGSPRTDPVTYLLDNSRYLVFGSNLGRPSCAKRAEPARSFCLIYINDHECLAIIES